MLPSSATPSHKMVCTHHLIFGHTFAIPFLILVISTTSYVRSFNVEGGRKLAQIPHNSKTVEEETAMWRAQIGSRPPRCERRCGSCGRCEAIQVPTNPQIKRSGVAEARDEGSSNYKPMSWKCKCGNLIFNP